MKTRIAAAALILAAARAAALGPATEWRDVPPETSLSNAVMAAGVSRVAWSGDYNDLTNKPAIPVPAPQVQSDWAEGDGTSPAFIRNKPTIPTRLGELEDDVGYATASDVEALGETVQYIGWNVENIDDIHYTVGGERIGLGGEFDMSPLKEVYVLGADAQGRDVFPAAGSADRKEDALYVSTNRNTLYRYDAPAGEFRPIVIDESAVMGGGHTIEGIAGVADSAVGIAEHVNYQMNDSESGALVRIEALEEAAARGIPAATTSTAGIVQLSNAVTNDETTAATPKAVMDGLAQKADAADAMLTERTGFTAWTLSPEALETEHWYIKRNELDGKWELYNSDDIKEGSVSAPSDATSLVFYLDEVVTATRTALSGYQLGSQTNKVLASEAEAEALRAALAAKQDALTTQQLANIAAVPSKANRAANPTSGNLAALDARGNPTNSGKKATDFVSLVQDLNGNKTAVAVGNRHDFTIVDGEEVELPVGPNSLTVGEDNAASLDAVATGYGTDAVGYASHAEGNNTKATGNVSHAEGTDTVASGLVAHAEGNYTTASGTGAHSEGMFAKASGPAAHAEGSNLDKLADLLQASGASAEIVALFRQAATDAAGSFSHTEGLVSATSEMGSHAQGFRARDGGNQFSFVWQGYSGQVPTAAQMQALLDDPTSQDAQIALQCLVIALNSRDAYTSKGPGTFNINPVGGADGFWIGETNFTQHVRNIAAEVSPPAPAAQPKRVAMFIIPVNEGGSSTYKGFELKCSTNNFASAASESVKLQFYSQSEIADEGSGSTIDKMKLFACTSYWSARDRRSYSPVANTIDYLNDLYSVVVLVDASCLKRHPEDNGAWLNEDNEDLVWCYLRDTANDVEREQLTMEPLWRPIAPVKWFRELPSWAR